MAHTKVSIIPVKTAEATNDEELYLSNDSGFNSLKSINTINTPLLPHWRTTYLKCSCQETIIYLKLKSLQIEREINMQRGIQNSKAPWAATLIKQKPKLL